MGNDLPNPTPTKFRSLQTVSKISPNTEIQSIHSEITSHSNRTSQMSYPNFEYIIENQQEYELSEGRPLVKSVLNNLAQSIVGRIYYKDNQFQSYSTGFLITDSLVLSAFNPICKRNEITGAISMRKPWFFSIQINGNLQFFNIIEFKHCKQYQDIVNKLGQQDYVHASLHDKVQFKKSLEKFDFCLLQLEKRVEKVKLMEIFQNYNGTEEVKIVGAKRLYDQSGRPFGLFEFQQRAFFSHQRLKIGIRLTEDCIGSPIIVKSGQTYGIVGIFIREAIYKSLSNGLIFNHFLLCCIERWMKELSYLPKRKRYQSNKLQNHLSCQEIIWNTNTPYSSHFQIMKTKVKRKTMTGEILQIVSQPITIDKSIKNYRLKLSKYGGDKSQTCFGIITNDNLNSKYSGDISMPKTIGFWTSNHDKSGKFIIDGKPHKKRHERSFLKQQDILTIQLVCESKLTRCNFCCHNQCGMKNVFTCSLRSKITKIVCNSFFDNYNCDRQ